MSAKPRPRRRLPAIEYASISASTVTDNFVCGLDDIEKWFRKSALIDHNKRKHIVTCASFEDEPDHVIGVYALSMVVEEVRNLGDGLAYYPFFGNNKYCPCLQLVYMAMRSEHQAQDHGTIMLGEITRKFADVGTEIGIPALILTPGDKRAAKFYKQRGGFVHYARGGGMFLPLRTAVETVTAAVCEEAAQSA